MSKRSENWRIRYHNTDEDSFFFIEADLPNAKESGHYPRLEVMQEDFGEHNGYTREMRLADARLIESAPKLLEALKVCYKSLCSYGKHPIIDKQVNNLLREIES